VWEEALERRNAEALEQGLAEALAQDVTFTTVTPDEQRRFDALYLSHAERDAAALASYGIDGLEVFARARASVEPDGNISCKGPND
jgi:hypothetical protein